MPRCTPPPAQWPARPASAPAGQWCEAMRPSVPSPAPHGRHPTLPHLLQCDQTAGELFGLGLQRDRKCLPASRGLIHRLGACTGHQPGRVDLWWQCSVEDRQHCWHCGHGVLLPRTRGRCAGCVGAGVDPGRLDIRQAGVRKFLLRKGIDGEVLGAFRGERKRGLQRHLLGSCGSERADRGAGGGSDRPAHEHRLRRRPSRSRLRPGLCFSGCTCRTPSMRI